MDRSPAAFGPFHRLKSGTQLDEVARAQSTGGEAWGTVARGSDRPKVKAYRGPLPAGLAGVEFYTDTPPDAGSPPFLAFWSGPRDGVRVEGEYAKIEVIIVMGREA